MHYKLSEEKKISRNGTVLHRIEALEGGPWGPVGTKGGWVESENNLLDRAWVYQDAEVHDNAKVFGHSQVCEKSWIHGEAKVYGNAHVAGHAEICEYAEISGNSKISGDAYIAGYTKVLYESCLE